MIQIVNSLLPVALLIALGAVLLRLGFHGEPFRKGLERFVYWVALPALFIGKLSQSEFAQVASGDLTLVLCISTVAATLVGWFTAKAMRLPPGEAGVFTQATLRGNLVFVGLPVIAFALEAIGIGIGRRTELLGIALLAIAPLVLLYNVISVIVLLLPQHGLGLSVVPRLLKSFVTNPLIVATAVGLVMMAMKWRPPTAVLSAMEMLGSTAAALALIALGGGLASLPLRGQWAKAMLAGALKVALVPVLTWAAAMAIGLSGQPLLIAMVLSACPTAVVSYVLATQLKGDGGLAASCVTMATVLSFPALSVVLYLFG